MKTINIKAGSLVLWREYGMLRKLWNKITKSNLPYNKVGMYTNTVEWIVIDETTLKDIKILEPKKTYSRFEVTFLKAWMENGKFFNTSEDVLEIVNSVRPNTIVLPTTLDNLINNKYYKVIC